MNVTLVVLIYHLLQINKYQYHNQIEFYKFKLLSIK
jgi:hypothetical protein